MNRSVLHMATLLVALAVAGAACGGPDSEGGAGEGKGGAGGSSAPPELEAIGDPGSDLSPYGVSYGSATAAGTDLVILESTFRAGGQLSAALRREDGTWWQLPDLPFSGYIQLSSADDRAVAGGIACTDDACTEREGRLAFAMLSEDHTRWERLDAPDVPLSVEDTELTTAPGLSELAGFAVGAAGYVVDESGHVVRPEWKPLPDPPEGAASEGVLGCSVGDRNLRMDTAFPDPDNVVFGSMPELVGQVYAEPADGSGHPEPIAPVEADFPVAGATFCSGTALTVLGEDTAANFIVGSRTWTVTASNLAELGTWISPITGRFATAADPSTVFVQNPDTEERVISRTGTGLWEDTGTQGHVFATESQVLVIGDDRSVTQVWPT